MKLQLIIDQASTFTALNKKVFPIQMHFCTNTIYVSNKTVIDWETLEILKT